MAVSKRITGPDTVKPVGAIREIIIRRIESGTTLARHPDLVIWASKYDSGFQIQQALAAAGNRTKRKEQIVKQLCNSYL